MARKLFVSLEDDLETPEVVAKETVTVAENDAEAAVAVINETVEDIKEDVETIEEAASDIETLEDHTEVVEESLAEDGEGITEEHAKTLDIAVEHILKKLNYPKHKSLSVENFGSIHSRKKATKIALEGFKETITELWEKLKAVAKQMWDKVVEFYNKYFTELGRLKSGLDALEKQVKEAKGGPKESVIKNNSLVKAFYDFKSKSIKIDEVIANHIGVTKGGLSFADGLTSLADSLASLFKKNADKVDLGEEALGEIVNVNDKLFDVLLSGKEEAGPFFNGSSFTLKEEEGSIGNQKMKFLVINYIPGEIKAEGLPALDKAGCEKYLSQAKELLVLTEKYKEKQAKIKAFQAAIGKISDAAISIIKTSSEEDAEGKKKVLNAGRTLITKLNTFYTRALTSIPGLNTNVIKAAMNYVQASLRNMGEAAAETKEEGDTKALPAA